jgi:hypothetical protein
VRATARNPDQSEIPQGATNWDDWLTAATGWPQWLEARRPAHRGLLKATGRAPATGDTQPCVISPEARFRGLENQLYRVEIHSEGGVTALGRVGTATFKWSRENGSVVFGVNALAGNVATVTSLGRGDRASLTANDWVELIDDELVWRDEPGILARVVSVDPDELSVTLEPRPGQSLPSYDRAGAAAVHAQLRRWDYRREPTSAATSSRPQSANDGALIVEEGKPLTLEDGVQITFSPAPVGAPYYYRSGDYWLIPARVATGDVEWRGPPAPPRGVTHHYAPLGIINVTDAAVSLTKSFRRLIKSSAAP